jgi:hypothetical protein
MSIFGKKPETYDEDKAKEFVVIIKWFVKAGAMLCLYFIVAYLLDDVNPLRGLIEILFFVLFWRLFISNKKI